MKTLSKQESEYRDWLAKQSNMDMFNATLRHNYNELQEVLRKVTHWLNKLADAIDSKSTYIDRDTLRNELMQCCMCLLRLPECSKSEIVTLSDEVISKLLTFKSDIAKLSDSEVSALKVLPNSEITTCVCSLIRIIDQLWAL